MNDGLVAKDFNAFSVLGHANLAGLGPLNGADCLVDIGPSLRDIGKQHRPTLDYPYLGIEASGNFENFISIGLDQSAPRGRGLELSIILGNFMVMQGDNMELVSHSGVSATKEGPISMLGLIELLIRLREVKGSRFRNGRGQGLKVVLSNVVVLSIRSFENVGTF